MLYADFHMHSNKDPCDRYIDYSPYQLIDRLTQKGINLASITHHHKLIFEKKWHDYAKSKNMILLPGVELNIQGADVLLINAKADNIHTFEQLANYKTKNPDTLIIAPHPFAPLVSSLKHRLAQHLELFDAIEINASMLFAQRTNGKAMTFAKKYNKPVIAGSDTHLLRQAGTASNKINATTWKQALQKIKDKKVRPRISHPSWKKYCLLYPEWFYKDYILQKALKIY